MPQKHHGLGVLGLDLWKFLPKLVKFTQAGHNTLDLMMEP